MIGRLAKEHIVADPGFNRWKIPPASIAIHLCIGSVYAWSIFNPALVKEHGVVTSAADDWTLTQVVWIFTVAIVCLGLSAAVAWVSSHISCGCCIWDMGSLEAAGWAWDTCLRSVR